MKTQVDDIEIVIGTNPRCETLSAFGHQKEKTGLQQVLSILGVKQLYFTGLAYDFCVCYSACDAASFGFETFVIKDATRSVNPEDETLVNKEYKNAGVKIISS